MKINLLIFNFFKVRVLGNFRFYMCLSFVACNILLLESAGLDVQSKHRALKDCKHVMALKGLEHPHCEFGRGRLPRWWGSVKEFPSAQLSWRSNYWRHTFPLFRAHSYIKESGKELVWNFALFLLYRAHRQR